MKKTKLILIVFLSLSFILGYWIMEPYNLNPFDKNPISLANTSSDKLSAFKETQLLKEKSDSLINNAILLNDFIGVTAGWYSEGSGTWFSTAGYSEKGNQIKPNNNTLFRIASVSKPMTAVAIMQLYEQDKIELDVPIQEYLPEYPISPKGNITIRQLLKHTSGVQHYSSTWDGISFTKYENAIEAIDEFKDRPLAFVPGSSYLYTSYGYTILGAIIEKVTKQSFQAYMEENIWAPAKMVNTTIEVSDAEYENKASLYIKWGSRFIKSPKTDLSVKAPAGGVITTAEDLLKFGQAVLNHTLIDSSTLHLMINSTDTLKQGTPYGFGWFVRESNRYGKILEHGGSQSGSSSFFRIYLDQQLVTATIANNFNSDDEMYFLTRDLSELVLDSAKIDLPVRYFRPQGPEILERYVGSYNCEGQILSISKKGKQLFAQTHPYPKVPIYPQSKEGFFYRVFDGQLEFNTKNDETDSIRFTGRQETKLYDKID